MLRPNRFIDTQVLPELKECHFKAACDVTNPLCGENGATYIYGPQKGILTEEEKRNLDQGMAAYARCCDAYAGTITKGAEACHKARIDSYFSILTE